MPKEITIPSNYSGSLEQENDIVAIINSNFTEIEKKIDEIDKQKMEFSSHVIDFEEYEISLYYSDNKTKAKILLDDDIIVVTVNNKETRIGLDGNII